DNHGYDDKNYKEVLAKLSLAATEHQSLIAMQKVQSLQSDENLLKRFAVRYISDLDLHAVNMLVETFPALNDDADVTMARTQAEILESLKNKPKLTLEDYKKHRSLFKSLDAHTSAKLFETFEELNSALPKNKALNFGLNNDITYIQFKNAKNTEMNFVLTEKPSEPMTEHKNIKVFAVADTNGFGWFEGSTNRDIFVSLKENGSWSEPFVLPVPVNSRYDECNPVLSSDMTLLYFSSDRGFNFGKKDIYVSVREDVKSWDSWSEPILLSEDLNTKDNDYVTGLNDKVLAISQDDSFNEENTLYLEGNTALDFIKGKVKSKNTHYTSPIRINIYDKQTLALKNIVRTNDKGFFAFLKPQKDIVMNCQASKYFSPLSENSPELYSIEDMVSKQELITIESPFDDNGNITLTGKKNLEILANSFKNTDYMLTIGIHAVKPTSKSDEKTLSEKQALQVIDVLTKNGMNKENIIATGYGKENIMQGWEKTNSMDIGAISK
ncbi:MAG: OmpA family protein, partial [Bacteroidales bacterium]|nr:OmpA family protein [Bacteroidales bacterium]